MESDSESDDSTTPTPCKDLAEVVASSKKKLTQHKKKKFDAMSKAGDKILSCLDGRESCPSCEYKDIQIDTLKRKVKKLQEEMREIGKQKQGQ